MTTLRQNAAWSRSARHGVLARADAAALASAWQHMTPKVSSEWLRPAESGLVMLQARIDAQGGVFRFGEASISRCAVRLRDDDHHDASALGIGYVLGRSLEHAQWVASFDALAQLPRWSQVVDTFVIAPLASEQTRLRAAATMKALSSRVDFFTVERGGGP